MLCCELIAALKLSGVGMDEKMRSSTVYCFKWRLQLSKEKRLKQYENFFFFSFCRLHFIGVCIVLNFIFLNQNYKFKHKFSSVYVVSYAHVYLHEVVRGTVCIHTYLGLSIAHHFKSSNFYFYPYISLRNGTKSFSLQGR